MHVKKVFLIIFLLIFFRSYTSHLNDLAIFYGTDKSSHWHNYAEIYEKYFAPLKDSRIKFLEIGLAMGYSAHMWEHYFTEAELHFIENEKNFLEIYQSHAPERSFCHSLDQANENELLEFISKTGGNFDIILDDGGHQMDQQINSFRTLFPALKSGGIYIIEDLATSFSHLNTSVTESLPGTTVFFLKELIDQINSFTVRPPHLPYFCADYTKHHNLNYYQQHIHSIHFYNCMVVIIKR
jgi:hypothetical protein